VLLEAAQLRPKSGETCADYLGNALVTWIGDDFEKFLDTIASDRGDNPELAKMGADRIDHCGLLADEQMARTVKHQATLLLRGLCWDEPHVAAGNPLPHPLSASHVFLLHLAIDPSQT